MLSDMMGQDVFLRGVSTYLKTHAHGSATSNDLWRALSDASRIDVAALMNSWITKVGRVMSEGRARMSRLTQCCAGRLSGRDGGRD